LVRIRNSKSQISRLVIRLLLVYGCNGTGNADLIENHHSDESAPKVKVPLGCRTQKNQGAGPRAFAGVTNKSASCPIFSRQKVRVVRNFMAGQFSIAAALSTNVAAVRDDGFPGSEDCY